MIEPEFKSIRVEASTICPEAVVKSLISPTSIELVVELPLPVTESRVSASVEVIVTVSPAMAVEDIPAPLIVKVSVVVLAVVEPESEEIVSQRFWSPVFVPERLVPVMVPLTCRLSLTCSSAPVEYSIN